MQVVSFLNRLWEYNITNMIFVLSDKFDRHADIVCEKLERNKSLFFRLNLDTESLSNTHINFDGLYWSISQNNIEINSSEISSVWVRRPFVEVSLEEENINDPSFRIWRGEWNKTLLGLYNSLKSLSWLNPLANAYRAENKYLQTDVAIKSGFILPSLITSNRRKDLIKFVKKHGNVVMKPMNQEFYQDSSDGLFKGLYVNIITEDHLEDFCEQGENPIVLQAYIDKLYEVRYTVVGNDHHACRIESQKSEQTKIDWRRYDIPNTPHYPFDPPENIKEKVNNLMKCFGLYYGALDFIVSPSGEWYFLEINTMGQWLWIEDLTGLKISDSIVNFLVNNKEIK